MKPEDEAKTQSAEGEGKPQEHRRPNRRRRHPGRREGQPKNETGEGQK